MFNNKNIFIALTYKCNAFCKKCMTRYHVNKDVEMQKIILDRITWLLKCNNYSGWISVGTGEPLLYDNFPYFVKNMLNVNDKIRLRLLTNGMVLSVDNPIAIFNERIKWGITMDAFNQDSLLGLQKGVNIETVKNNIVNITQKYGGSQLYLNFTVYENNIDEIFPFCKFAIENGITEIYLTELKIFKGYEEDLKNFRVIHDKHLTDTLNAVEDYLSSNNISTSGINIGKTCNRSCCYLKDTASPMIDVDGSVSFCSGREDMIIANIMDSDIEKKWIDYAKYIKSTNLPWCESCYDKISNNGIYNLPRTIRKENKAYD